MFGNQFTRIEKLTSRKNAAGLIPLTANDNEEIRLAAIRGLASLDNDEGYAALVSLIHDSSAAVRKASILSLAETNRPSARAHIEHRMHIEKDSQVLSAMQTALTRLKDRQ